MTNRFTHCIKHRDLGTEHIVSRHRDELHAMERLKWYGGEPYYIEPLELEPNCEVVG